MIKSGLVISLWFCCSFVYSQTIPLDRIRVLYQQADTEKKACKKLIELADTFNGDNSLMLGYKGSATMMMAKHVVNPFKKLKYFNRGRNMLEKAIKSDTENIELRFLRYAVQKNAPSFLGYREDIEADEQYLNRSLEKLNDPELEKLINTQLTHS